jgi:hypothetical protein
MLEAKLIDGVKNAKVIIKGVLEGEFEKASVLKGLSHAKLMSAIWAIQEKMGFVLWWDEKELIMPMESRNSIRLDRGWEPPKGWNGELLLNSFGYSNGPTPKHFVIELDFDK